MANTLSAEQRRELVQAYRKILKARNHDKALSKDKAVRLMYAYFSERFGVDVESLRKLIRKDERENPKLYNKLRSGPRSRQGAIKPVGPAEESADEPGGEAPARTHLCRVCGEVVFVNKRGALRLHDVAGQNGLVSCSGAGMIVTGGRGNRRRGRKKGIDPVSKALPASVYAATTGRLNDTAKSNAKGVRKIISGGSPGLGKNSK